LTSLKNDINTAQVPAVALSLCMTAKIEKREIFGNVDLGPNQLHTKWPVGHWSRFCWRENKPAIRCMALKSSWQFPAKSGKFAEWAAYWKS